MPNYHLGRKYFWSALQQTKKDADEQFLKCTHFKFRSESYSEPLVSLGDPFMDTKSVNNEIRRECLWFCHHLPGASLWRSHVTSQPPQNPPIYDWKALPFFASKLEVPSNHICEVFRGAWRPPHTSEYLPDITRSHFWLCPDSLLRPSSPLFIIIQICEHQATDKEGPHYFIFYICGL